MDILSRNQWLGNNFRPASGGVRYDLVSNDGQIIVDVQRRSLGIRDINAAAMNVAVPLSEDARIKWGCLVVLPHRISTERLKKEWQRILRVLNQSIASRMALIHIDHIGAAVEPRGDPFLQQLANAFMADFTALHESLAQIVPEATPSFFEVTKVLMNAWLMGGGPMKIGELSDRTGFAFSTISKSLDLLQRRHEVDRVGNRSVALTRFPKESWNELLARSKSLRMSLYFVDASGQPPTAEHLYRRLQKLGTADLATGGTMAARYWCPEFDLNGDPRLDIVVHAPFGIPDVRFVKDIDPALEVSKSDTRFAVLAAHVVARHDPMFASDPDMSLPWADPVETALDLYDLRLESQAKQLLSHFRPEARLM
jgi:hypothetical protein